MPSTAEIAASCGSENLILCVFLAKPRHGTAFKLGRDVRGCGFAACHTAPRKGVHKSLGTPNGAYRIVLCVEIAEHEVILHNIGSHDEVYG